MPDIDKLKEKLHQSPNIVFALLFGSYANNSRKSPKDVDLALFFKNPPSGLDLLNFIHELSEFFGKEIDLVVLNRASAFLRHQIIKHCIRLFIKDHHVYRRFREKTMMDYDNYKYLSGMARYDR